MKIEITVSRSKKDIDVLASFMEGLQGLRIITRDVHIITTPDDSSDNIQKWLSDERKLDYAQKLNESQSEFTFEVEKISISNK